MADQVNRYTYIDDKVNKATNRLSVADVDLSLLNKIADGDESAFLELYQFYHTPLYNYLLRLVWVKETAEDLLQEVFIAVWRGASRFRRQSTVKTWLYQIAHHQAVSWLRRDRNHVPLEEDGRELVESGLENQVIDLHQAEQVRRAINGLSTDHRSVVELAFFHGMSYGEIASVIGCPVGTVKSRMSHARQRLNNALQALKPDERQLEE